MDPWLTDSNWHFEAEITIYPLGPTTRSHHPLNGIRWAFAYADDEMPDGATQSNVWPEFIDEAGETIPDDVPLHGTLKARMHIMFPNMVPEHLSRVYVGMRFYCKEASRRVAAGVITAIRTP